MIPNSEGAIGSDHAREKRDEGAIEGSDGALVTEVNLLDLRIVLDRRHAAFGEDLALMKHGHPVGDAFDELHVVLDDDDGAAFGHELQQLRGARALRYAHSRLRLVEHQKL